MGKRNGLSRGDHNRNQRLGRLRGLLPAGHAIVAVDLGQRAQSVVVCDHDSRVLARRRVKAGVWELGPVLAWAATQARRAGFGGVTVACEPTGHRWRVVEQLAAERGMRLVCVQPLLIGRAREAEEYTADKTDDKDAVLIARLAGELRCYAPEQADATWARLRQLGRRRERLVVEHTSCVLQLRDLLECAWPAVLATAAEPFAAITFQACLGVVLERCNGHPERLRRLGWQQFAHAVRGELPRWDGKRCCWRIVRAAWAALADPRGVVALRGGLLERARLVVGDWRAVRQRLADVEERMVGVLDELDLTELVASIPGLSLVGAAAILAQTGDPARFHSPRALVKHAGLAPRRQQSGAHQGTSRVSRRGQPGLRLAAWRAVWAALGANPVYAARFRYLTSRSHNRLSRGQAHAAIAAALLRHLQVICTHRVTWDAALAGPTDQPQAA